MEPLSAQQEAILEQAVVLATVPFMSDGLHVC